MDKKQLINAPFAVLHPQGIRGVFSPSEICEILQLAERYATPLPQLIDEVEALAALVNAHLRRMGMKL